MPGIHYYGPDGQPLTLKEFCSQIEDPKARRVAEDWIGPRWVSTVWLGIDHGFGMAGPPLIFETMVFDGNPEQGAQAVEDFTQRYPTREAAEEGHRHVVDLVQWDTEHTEHDTFKSRSRTDKRNGR